jgi:hypothetical protein
VQAFDKAGNYTTASEEFVIKSIEPPVIGEYPKQIKSGEVLMVKGASRYANADIIVWLAKDKEEPKKQIVKSDESGAFTFIAEEKLKDGIYKLWAEVIDKRGAISNPSEKVVIAVSRPALLRIGSVILDYLSLANILVACFLLLVAILWYGWHKFLRLKKKLRKEVREAETALHKAFDLLNEDIREQIKLLEKTRTKRQLTEEEEKIIKQLKKDLDDAEKFVRKEIEDIEREVK